MEQKLLKIFEGNSELFITTSLTGEVDERGKKQVKVLTVHEPVTLELWKKHLKGETRIGIKPENGDVCKWGCIDIDPRNYTTFSEKKIVDIIRDNQLPLIAVRSKSGGLHLFLFLNDWYPIKEVLKVLNDWNKTFFYSEEVFPMNKCLNMPYFNMDQTTEFAYNDNNTPVMINNFLEMITKKTVTLEQLNNIKVKEYEPESDWKHYPPCVQKMISEKWEGNHRNELLFNVGVLEMKKADGSLNANEIQNILQKRNYEIFTTPLDPKEVETLSKSISKKDYAYKCPPKTNAIAPLCNKDLCKLRKLGIGSQVPDMIDDFEDVEFIRSTKSIEYTFKFQDEKIIINPEDMKDEKSFRVKLLRYGIYWMTLPKPKSGPSPFEMLMATLVRKAVENASMKFKDTLDEEKYNFLKKFFESHIEEDDFEKLKDNYVILDSSSNICYFKKITFEKFLGSDKTFKSASEALNLLNCDRLDYHEGVKNVWSVMMPKFVDYKVADKKKQLKLYRRWMTNSTQESLELKILKELYHKTVKIFGPPGTGKTYTLIEKVLKSYLRKGIRPNDIAYLSFTNKAVNTAVRRAMESFPNYSTEDFSRFKTLHTYCRRYFPEEVFDPKDCTIDFALQTKVIKSSDKRLADDNFMYKDWSLGVYSKARNLLIDPEEAYKMEGYKRDSLTVFKRKIDTYEHYKTGGGERSFIDFDDMIQRAITEVDFPPLKVLILDEAQDCTPLQWSVLYKMAPKVDRIYLAGDDDQAIYKWNGADPKYFTKFFPGRKVKLRKTQRFGEAIHRFSQVIRRGIRDSEEKEYQPGESKGSVKSYLSFKEIPFESLKEDWYILGRINETVNELRMLAKDAGLYYKDNKGTKCFDQKQWEAIKAWTTISMNKKIDKRAARNMVKYIRELDDPAFRLDKFWRNEPDLRDYDFQTLKEWCGLALEDTQKNKPWYWILRRNFKPKQVRHFIRLLRRYGQKELDKDPLITIDTIHSVKGGEANHVVLYSKGNYPSDYANKNKQEKSDERKVWYTGATRARKTLHLLRTDYKFNYPIGSDYLIYVQEKNDK